MPHDDTVRLFDADKLVGVDSMFVLIPVEQLGLKTLSSQITDVYVTHQFPQLLLVVVICCICLHTGFHIEHRIKLLHKNPPFECPIRRTLPVEDQPLFRVDAVAGNAGIGDEGHHPLRVQHGQRIALGDGLSQHLAVPRTSRK